LVSPILEHLLLALVDDRDAADVIRGCKGDLDKLRKSLVAYVENELENLIADGSEDSKPTAGFQRVIQRAVIHVQSSGREVVTGAHVLVVLFAERESHAAYFRQEQDINRYNAVNFISHDVAKYPLHEPNELLVLSGESDQKLEEWLVAVVESAGFGVRLYRKVLKPGARLTEAMSTNKSAPPVVAIITPEFRKSVLYNALIKRTFFDKLVSQRILIPLVLGAPVRIAPLSEIAQVNLLSAPAESVCEQLFSALNYHGDYQCFAEKFAAAKGDKSSRKVAQTRRNNKSRRIRKHKDSLPGAEDFVWKEGVLRHSEFVALEIKLGDTVLNPESFLNDYCRLISEFTSQLGVSNHSSYVKSQAKHLFDEIQLGPSQWDPQTVDRRIRALFTLILSDDCPMNKLIELNFQEVKDYQSIFRRIYPIVGDRERAMGAFAIPDSAPLQEARQIAQTFKQTPELIDAGVVQKLDALVEEIKIVEKGVDLGLNETSSKQSDEEKKRLIYKLGIMLNSLWGKLKEPPELI
jgi:hypothetical protein